MSLDPMPVYMQANRWKGAEHLHMPRSQIEPVIWVDKNDSLAMYHPAMQLDIKTPAQAWTHAEFSRLVGELLPEACRMIEQKIMAQGLPSGFYSHYPEYALKGTAEEQY